MPDETEHNIEIKEFGIWQQAPIINAECSCGEWSMREQVPRDVVEAAARKHVAQQQSSQD